MEASSSCGARRQPAGPVLSSRRSARGRTVSSARPNSGGSTKNCEAATSYQSASPTRWTRAGRRGSDRELVPIRRPEKDHPRSQRRHEDHDSADGHHALRCRHALSAKDHDEAPHTNCGECADDNEREDHTEGEVHEPLPLRYYRQQASRTSASTTFGTHSHHGLRGLTSISTQSSGRVAGRLKSWFSGMRTSAPTTFWTRSSAAARPEGLLMLGVPLGL